MNYKRITRSKDEITYRDPMYIRLQELEDKIENNEIVDVKENHLIQISRASGKTSLNTVEILTKYENGLLKELSENSVVLSKEEVQEHDKKLANDIITMFQKLAQNWASADIVNDTAKRLRKLYEV